MLRALVLLIVASLMFACAKFPVNGPGTFTKRIRFTMQLAAPVNPNYVYIIAINDGDDLTGAGGGPIPVIAPPWGNGFVAGQATHFVRYDPALPGGGYGVFRFLDPNLLNYVQTGIPVNFFTPGPNDDMIEFEIDLVQIRAVPAQALKIQALQINFLTMNRVITNPNDPGPKIWDALGNSLDPGSINDYITIDVRSDRVYRNSDLNIEPAGDVQEPALDIIDWTIEIRSQ